MKKKLNTIELHSTEATVRHISPFNELVSYKNEEALTQDFTDQWVRPFYMNLRHSDDDWVSTIQQLKGQITDEIIFKNLGDFNWRPKATGAFFAAVQGATHFTDVIGTHLLKSEVCCSGSQYARTLASFNTDKSIEYLNRYLEYYLTRIDLVFDQVSVMTALVYLDEENQTNEKAKHAVKWQAYIKESSEKAEADFNKTISELALDIDQLPAYSGYVDYWKSKLNIEAFRKSVKVIERIKSSTK